MAILSLPATKYFRCIHLKKSAKQSDGTFDNKFSKSSCTFFKSILIMIKQNKRLGNEFRMQTLRWYWHWHTSQHKHVINKHVVCLPYEER